MSDQHPIFDTEPFAEEFPTMPKPTLADIPHVATESPAEKRARIMAAGDVYRADPAAQTAAQTWATVELRDELARANDIAEARAKEERVANLIAFYNTNPNVFPPGVRDQIAAMLDVRV